MGSEMCIRDRSVAFSGLVAPAAIGNLALNTRYLQRAGVPAGAAPVSYTHLTPPASGLV